ncbi:MAG: DUF4365 domain-containing protein [Bacteroidota bacterium]
MRKLRTRQHIIEDLSFNHFEKHVLLAGYTFERLRRDYSYDANITTFSETGELENDEIKVQMKSTDHLLYSEVNKGYEFSLSDRDLETWLNSRLPVLLILYDAQKDVAYYLEMLDYFRQNRHLLRKIKKFVQVFFPPENVVTLETIQHFRTVKNELR